MPEDVTDAQDAWWRRWWEQDWSWAGLADKPVGQNGDTVHGGRHGERTLQEYWRRDPESGLVRDDAAMEAAGELIRAPDGILWHLAHVPLAWASGEPAKAGWDAARIGRLANLVAWRVHAAQETDVDGATNAKGSDGRAQLTGAVLVTAPSLPKGGYGLLRLVCDGAWLRRWDTRGADFDPGFRCEAAVFVNGALFDRATFTGGSNFSDATFARYTSFAGARFSGDASFHGVTFFDDADLNNASFSGYADFGRATFSRNGEFFGATFSQDTDFGQATFLGDASFTRATLSGEAIFERVTFLGYANFDIAEFAKEVTFDSAQFGADPLAPDRPAGALFHRCQFTGPADFRGARFLARMDFSTATFVRQAWFTNIDWPRLAADWQAGFNQAVFRDVASFRDSGFQCFAAFDGASFGGGLQLDDTSEAAANRRFREELAQARRRKGLRASVGAWPSACIAAWLAGPAPSQGEKPDAALQHLERGCRVLKQAMEKSSHKTREQILHAFELIARRNQRDTPAFEKWVSRLYAAISDYGRSIWRPMILLLLSIPAFALMYWLALNPLPDRSPAELFRECLAFSLDRLLPVTTGPTEAGTVRALLFGRGSTVLEVAARLLAGLQLLLSIGLVFLAGLAIRRRFQMT